MFCCVRAAAPPVPPLEQEVSTWQPRAVNEFIAATGCAPRTRKRLKELNLKGPELLRLRRAELRVLMISEDDIDKLTSALADLKTASRAASLDDIRAPLDQLGVAAAAADGGVRQQAACDEGRCQGQEAAAAEEAAQPAERGDASTPGADAMLMVAQLTGDEVLRLSDADVEAPKGLAGGKQQQGANADPRLMQAAPALGAGRLQKPDVPPPALQTADSGSLRTPLLAEPSSVSVPPLQGSYGVSPPFVIDTGAISAASGLPAGLLSTMALPAAAPGNNAAAAATTAGMQQQPLTAAELAVCLQPYCPAASEAELLEFLHFLGLPHIGQGILALQASSNSDLAPQLLGAVFDLHAMNSLTLANADSCTVLCVLGLHALRIVDTAGRHGLTVPPAVLQALLSRLAAAGRLVRRFATPGWLLRMVCCQQQDGAFTYLHSEITSIMEGSGLATLMSGSLDARALGGYRDVCQPLRRLLTQLGGGNLTEGLALLHQESLSCLTGPVGGELAALLQLRSADSLAAELEAIAASAVADVDLLYGIAVGRQDQVEEEERRALNARPPARATSSASDGGNDSIAEELLTVQQALFNLYDVNYGGALGPAECSKVLCDLGLLDPDTMEEADAAALVARHYRLADADNDGVLGLEDFCAYWDSLVLAATGKQRAWHTQQPQQPRDEEEPLMPSSDQAQGVDQAKQGETADSALRRLFNAYAMFGIRQHTPTAQAPLAAKPVFAGINRRSASPLSVPPSSIGPSPIGGQGSAASAGGSAAAAATASTLQLLSGAGSTRAADDGGVEAPPAAVPVEMDGFRFAKLVREAGLLEPGRLTAADVDIVFQTVKARGSRRITYVQFLRALGLLATKSGLTNKQVLLAVLRLAASGPAATNVTHAQPVRLHDDKATFTGVHAHGGPSTVDPAKDLGSLLHVHRGPATTAAPVAPAAPAAAINRRATAAAKLSPRLAAAATAVGASVGPAGSIAFPSFSAYLQAVKTAARTSGPSGAAPASRPRANAADAAAAVGDDSIEMDWYVALPTSKTKGAANAAPATPPAGAASACNKNTDNQNQGYTASSFRFTQQQTSVKRSNVSLNSLRRHSSATNSDNGVDERDGPAASELDASPDAVSYSPLGHTPGSSLGHTPMPTTLQQMVTNAGDGHMPPAAAGDGRASRTAFAAMCAAVAAPTVEHGDGPYQVATGGASGATEADGGASGWDAQDTAGMVQGLLAQMIPEEEMQQKPTIAMWDQDFCMHVSSGGLTGAPINGNAAHDECDNDATVAADDSSTPASMLGAAAPSAGSVHCHPMSSITGATATFTTVDGPAACGGRRAASLSPLSPLPPDHPLAVLLTAPTPAPTPLQQPPAHKQQQGQGHAVAAAAAAAGADAAATGMHGEITAVSSDGHAPDDPTPLPLSIGGSVSDDDTLMPPDSVERVLRSVMRGGSATANDQQAAGRMATPRTSCASSAAVPGSGGLQRSGSKQLAASASAGRPGASGGKKRADAAAPVKPVWNMWFRK